MRKAIRQTATTLIALLCLLALPAAAFADGTADFNGQGAANVWEYDADPVNVRAYGYDAFGDAMKELSPGDVRTVRVRLRNNTPDSVLFRLAANPLTGAEAEGLEGYYSGKDADDGLLDEIRMEVLHGASRVYDGTLRGAAMSGDAAMYTAAGVSLGTVSAGYSGTVTVNLSVPQSVDSSFMDKLCAIEWRFVATQYNDVETSPEIPTENPPPTVTSPPTGQTDDESRRSSDQDEDDEDDEEDQSGSGGSGSGGGAASPTIDDEPVAELPEADAPQDAGAPDEPQIEVEATPTPTSPGQGETGGASWALWNLLLTILAGVQMLWLLIRYARARDRARQRAHWREEHPGDADAEDYYDWRVRRKNSAWLTGLVGVVISAILFIMTEDMRLPMIQVNRYTIVYAAVNIVILLFHLYSVRKREYGNEAPR